jgi:hypothetical protein
MSRVTFDGDDIFIRPKIDPESFIRWKRRQEKDLGKILKQEQAEREDKAIDRWKQMVPDLYKGATVESVSKYDPHVADAMTRMAGMIIDNPSIPRHLALSSDTIKYADPDGQAHKRALKGKTWAAFAYLDCIVRSTSLITDPENEISYALESQILDDLYSYTTKKDTLRRLVNGQKKIIIIDSCGQVAGGLSKIRSDVFNTLIDAVNANGHISMVLVISSNPWVLEEFKPLIERLQPKARKLLLKHEPDGAEGFTV